MLFRSEIVSGRVRAGESKTITLDYSNWLATTGRVQPVFPPLPVTNVLQFPTIKSFRNESFLRRRYLEEGASLDQIAAETLSSRKTVRRYVMEPEAKWHIKTVYKCLNKKSKRRWEHEDPRVLPPHPI